MTFRIVHNRLVFSSGKGDIDNLNNKFNPIHYHKLTRMKLPITVSDFKQCRNKTMFKDCFERKSKYWLDSMKEVE